MWLLGIMADEAPRQALMSFGIAGVLALLLGGGIGGAQNWERASERVVRLAPSAFKELPGPIVEDLRGRGCTIPQPFAARGLENAVEGRFTSSRQKDWAVLCSRRGVSTILVFRGGSTSSVQELAASADSVFLQVVGPNGAVGFSRAIGVADRHRVRRHAGDMVPPPLEHDGIEDRFLEKGSTIWYWHHDRWLELPGAD